MKTGFKKGLTLFIWAGLISAIGAYITQYFMTYDVRSSVWVQLEALIVTGLALALIGLFFARYPRSKRGMTVLQFILLPLLGIGMAFLTADFTTRVPSGEWNAMAQPPERSESFIDSEHASVHGDDLYIKGVSGTTYVYDCKNAVDCTWTQQEYTPASSSQSINCGVEDPVTPATPGKVADSLISTICGVDGRQDSKFILLENGSLYYWTGTFSINDWLLRLYGFSLFNFIAGLAVSFVVMRMRRSVS
jgi:hypothetical protein